MAVLAGILIFLSFAMIVVDVRSVDMPQWALFGPMPFCLFFVAVEFARYLFGVDDMYDKSVGEREGV